MARQTEALDTIRHHLEAEEGLLSQLRPYTGPLREDDLAQLTAAYEALGSGEVSPSYRLLDAAYVLIHLVRRWAIEPEGALAASGKLSAGEQAQLRAAVLSWEESFRACVGHFAETEGTATEAEGSEG